MRYCISDDVEERKMDRKRERQWERGVDASGQLRSTNLMPAPILFSPSRLEMFNRIVEASFF